MPLPLNIPRAWIGRYQYLSWLPRHICAMTQCYWPWIWRLSCVFLYIFKACLPASSPYFRIHAVCRSDSPYLHLVGPLPAPIRQQYTEIQSPKMALGSDGSLSSSGNPDSIPSLHRYWQHSQVSTPGSSSVCGANGATLFLVRSCLTEVAQDANEDWLRASQMPPKSASHRKRSSMTSAPRGAGRAGESAYSTDLDDPERRRIGGDGVPSATDVPVLEHAISVSSRSILPRARAKPML